LFGFPGVGKTTFGATSKTLVIDLEGGTEVLADRPDVMVWPGVDPKTGKRKKVTWADLTKFCTFLQRELMKGSLPFEVIVWDTVGKAYEFALAETKGPGQEGRQPGLQEYGQANEQLLTEIHRWCGLARDYGIAVLFNVHAEEKEINEGKDLVIRMGLTPGVIKGLVGDVAAIGYLEVKTNKTIGPGGKPVTIESRRLQFHQDSKMAQPKYRQPMSGTKLPQVLEGDQCHISHILAHRQKLLQELRGTN